MIWLALAAVVLLLVVKLMTRTPPHALRAQPLSLTWLLRATLDTRSRRALDAANQAFR